MRILRAFRRPGPVPRWLGEVAEWLKAHAWKACLGETLTRVRIPLSPPAWLFLLGFFGRCYFTHICTRILLADRDERWPRLARDCYDRSANQFEIARS